MAGFLALFILGSFWWYVVTLGWVIWAIVLTEKESLFWTFISFSLYLAFLSTLGKLNVFSYLFYNPVRTLLYVAGYFLIGVIWSFMKWWLKVSEAAEKYKEEKKKFFEKKVDEHEKSSIPLNYHRGTVVKKSNDLIDRWQSHIQYKDEIKKPVAAENKAKISIWIVYWPFSFFWSLLHDIVRRAVELFVTKFQKFYQAISDKAYNKIEPVKEADPAKAYEEEK